MTDSNNTNPFDPKDQNTNDLLNQQSIPLNSSNEDSTKQNHDIPYQYSPNTGWETPSTTSQQYAWNINEYADEMKQNHSFENSNSPKNKSSSKKIVTLLASCVAAIVVLSFAGYGAYTALGGLNSQKFVDESPVQDPTSDSGKPNIMANDRPKDYNASTSGIMTTPEIYKKLQNSVVGIVSYYSGTLNSAGGSGFIISEDGYIATNAHVISEASGIKVVLSNNEEYEARLIGLDETTDIAVIKIDATGLDVVEVGNSDQLEVGEDIIAIGCPTSLELAGSLTKGVVSAINRVIATDVSANNKYIQIDAAINPGNSGGVLVNSNGQVIGINTLKIIENGVEGIGFAIPINDALPIINDLITNGKVTGRPKLGITGEYINEITATMNNLPVTGIRVIETDPLSNIAQKKVITGDIITKINGISINSFSTLKDELNKHKAGDSVSITVFRRTQGQKDKTFDVNIILMEQ